MTRVCYLIICFQPNPKAVFFVLSNLYILYDAHYDLHLNDILFLIYLNKIMKLHFMNKDIHICIHISSHILQTL